MDRKLHKSKTNRVFSGVIGGFAETYNLDASLLRIIYVILSLTPFPGILVYLVAMLVVPEK